jgi:hypothetical protein
MSIELVDIYGKVVRKLFEGKFTSDKTEFDVSDLPVGLYFIKISLDDKSIIRKLIKQ